MKRRDLLFSLAALPPLAALGPQAVRRLSWRSGKLSFLSVWTTEGKCIQLSSKGKLYAYKKEGNSPVLPYVDYTPGPREEAELRELLEEALTTKVKPAKD